MPTIHPTALVSPDAHVAESVEIGAYSVIEAGVHLAENVTIDGHVSLRKGTKIGAGTRIGWGSVIGADPQDLSFDPTTISHVEIGEANQIREYVTIHRGSKPDSVTRVGRENFLMTGAHLAHDVEIGDFNVLANNVLLAGHVRVGSRVFLGGGAGFHQFIRIGDFAIVQGNSSISQDVPPYCMAYGANMLGGLNVIGLRRNQFSAEVRAEIKTLQKLLLSSAHLRSEGLALAAEKSWSPEARVLLDAVVHCSKKGIISQ